MSRPYKARSNCHIADSQCLNPAGTRTGMGIALCKPTTLWECPTCGEPTCKNCRKESRGKTVCSRCAAHEEDHDKDPVVKYLRSLKVKERVIETSQSMTFGWTGTTFLSKTPGHGMCVRWDNMIDGGHMSTAVTGGTRRIKDVLQVFNAHVDIDTLGKAKS